ncbi:MAG TPA: glycosyltransferase family A protein [Thermoanaerobaculia bacterium]|nr:glycosyltransferase family A protein [Thermoanaerobaculia bacterium]
MSPEPFKFSIVMPTYRRPHTIHRTIASIRAQTYREWELIVVDNAGDGGYGFEDPRIRVLVHSEKTSASHARNMGLLYASGDLVCFFDDDDDMYPDYLAELASAFRAHPAVCMVRCGMLMRSGKPNFSHATPECCLRREFATPTWDGLAVCEDQRYFQGIARTNGWTEERGEVVMISKVLCASHGDPVGGLRAGRV